jgi:preprotein translocase subunit SecG
VTILTAAVVVVHMLLAFSAVALVLMHSGKDAGLSGAFGVGSSQFGGTQIMERNLTRLTIAVGIGLTITTITLGFLL